jgi:thioredoxin-like negative regulator of GroEL
VYFSAHWCPPCRQFTPQLASLYKQAKAAGRKFEVVFVSADREESGFKECVAAFKQKRIAPWTGLRTAVH